MVCLFILQDMYFYFTGIYFTGFCLFMLQDLVVRIIFILGNLTAKNNQSREQFFQEKESVNTLISLFQTYYELDLNAPTWHHDRQGEKHLKYPSEAEDVLIKLMRVLANLSIHPRVGTALAAAHPVVGLLVTVLGNKISVVFVIFIQPVRRVQDFQLQKNPKVNWLIFINCFMLETDKLFLCLRQ